MCVSVARATLPSCPGVPGLQGLSPGLRVEAAEATVLAHRPGCLPQGRADSGSLCHPSTERDVPPQHLPKFSGAAATGPITPGWTPAQLFLSLVSLCGSQNLPSIRLWISSKKWSRSRPQKVQSDQARNTPMRPPSAAKPLLASTPQHGRSLLYWDRRKSGQSL